MLLMALSCVFFSNSDNNVNAVVSMICIVIISDHGLFLYLSAVL